MRLKSLEIVGFKSFAKKTVFKFDSDISAIVGPNGSGKSNVAESFRFVLGEQSIKSLRGKRGEDLIFNGNTAGSRQNKASVKVTFDNADRSLKIDYDEVTISRTVFRDGVNEYFINDSAVRLKDITELLSGANIGSSGHHMISQGEADRILNTSVKERRSILEEALGLRIFQYKKLDSQRRLEKTEENLKQIESLRREIIPHLKFLRKQVEKIEKGKELKEQLTLLYQEYLAIENEYLNNRGESLDKDIIEPKKELDSIKAKIAEYQNSINNSNEDESHKVLVGLESDLSNVLDNKNNLNRKIGQLEGEISSITRLKERQENQKDRNDEVRVSISDVKKMTKEVNQSIEKALEDESSLEALKQTLLKIKDVFTSFIKSKEVASVEDNSLEFEKEISELNKQKTDIENELKEIENTILDLNNKIETQKNEIEKNKDLDQTSKQEIFDLMNKKNELEQAINKIEIERDSLQKEKEEYKREVEEAYVLVGRHAVNIESFNLEKFKEEDRKHQLDRRRSLERLKIKVEENGTGSDEDVLKEFKEVSEREEFLIKEIADLEKTSASLKNLILELDERINMKFKEGLNRINEQFRKFFSLMFNGGEASLKIVGIAGKGKKKDEDLENLDSDSEDSFKEEAIEEGVDINVNLPRKKIKGLMMLSGGERALTSIALLFAMSAVNPPPFIILDETDAALDEANSKKYADMIENLSEHSQLILVTHNRQTMSRASVLYGVTMQDGISQTLSIKFDEGIKYAK